MLFLVVIFNQEAIPSLNPVSINSSNINEKLIDNFSIENFLSKSNFKNMKSNKKHAKNFYSEYSELNIIYADDESFIRQSAIRCIDSACKDLKVPFRVIESEDGIETYFLFYKCLLEGIKIDIIFSDECMIYQKGSRTSELINELSIMKNLSFTPFYLVTAYEKEFIKANNKGLTDILPKPLSKSISLKIIKQYLKSV